MPTWFKRLPLFPLFFTYVFVSSGALVSIMMIVLAFTLWPISKTAYRRISSLLAYSILGQFAWICYDWAGMSVRLFGDEEAFDNFGKEFSLVTLSHRGDLDWVAGYLVASQFNFIHTIRTLPKSSIKYVPGFGQILWALECIFLSRNFAKDEIAIRKISEVYKNYPFPIQVCIFCEGTRFTQAKYQEGVQYAKDRGLPVLKHHLVPRTKGFSVLAHYLRTKGNFKALYDIGFAFPGVSHTPNFTDLLLGRPLTVFLYVRRILMEEVPDSREELCDYCYKLYQHKDEAYDYCLKNGVYPVAEYKKKPMTSRVLWMLRATMIFWVIVMAVLPCVFITLFLSWGYLIFLLVLTIIFNGSLTIALLLYSHQPMGSPEPASPTKKTE